MRVTSLGTKAVTPIFVPRAVAGDASLSLLATWSFFTLFQATMQHSSPSASGSPSRD